MGSEMCIRDRDSGDVGDVGTTDESSSILRFCRDAFKVFLLKFNGEPSTLAFLEDRL